MYLYVTFPSLAPRPTRHLQLAARRPVCLAMRPARDKSCTERPHRHAPPLDAQLNSTTPVQTVDPAGCSKPKEVNP